MVAAARDLIAWVKFTVNKPLDIPLPPTERHVIEPKQQLQIRVDAAGVPPVALKGR